MTLLTKLRNYINMRGELHILPLIEIIGVFILIVIALIIFGGGVVPFTNFAVETIRNLLSPLIGIIH